MNETPLHFKTITEVAALIKTKALSPVELTETMLNRIQAQDSKYKSYITVMAAQARTSAQSAERAITAGNYQGPLHGVPIAVKDLCFTKGVATMGGTKALKDHVPDFNGTVVERLNAAVADQSVQIQHLTARFAHIEEERLPRVEDSVDDMVSCLAYGRDVHTSTA